MRLPLGVLSGIKFIGAGAIPRRSQLVIGFTTAATRWFVIIMGLCFGGGQTGLGLAAFAIATVVLWCFPWLERRMRHERIGTLTLSLKEEPSIEEELRSNLGSFNPRIICWAAAPRERRLRELTCPTPLENAPQ